jgi:hypothetical protein
VSDHFDTPAVLLLGKESIYIFYRWLGGPQIQSGQCGIEKHLDGRCRESNHGRPARRGFVDLLIPLLGFLYVKLRRTVYSG